MQRLATMVGSLRPQEVELAHIMGEQVALITDLNTTQRIHLTIFRKEHYDGVVDILVKNSSQTTSVI